MSLKEAAQLALKAIEDGELFSFFENEVFNALSQALAQPDPQPIAWYHPVSGRVRWDGSNLPDSWLPLYPEPKYSVQKQEKEMNAGEKVTRYLQDRKKPVEAQEIAYHYLLSTSTVGKRLNELERAGKASRIIEGKITRWLWNRQPVAVPPSPPPVQQIKSTPYRPTKQTSYPHIRGYED